MFAFYFLGATLIFFLFLAWLSLRAYESYHGYMNLKRSFHHTDQSSEAVHSVVRLMARRAYVFDVLFNWIVLSILMLEIPRERLATTRLIRHKRDSLTALQASRLSQWRWDLSQFICVRFLDWADPSGCHCDLAHEPTKDTPN